MTLGQIFKIGDIPYLNLQHLSGRFITTLMFFDEDWRFWLGTAEKEQFVEVHAWPAEGFYWSAHPVGDNDHAFAFLNFIAQFANFDKVGKPFQAIQDDYFNIAASLKKLELIHGASESHDGSTRMAATEVECLLAQCRSIFDYVQEIIAHLWSMAKPIDINTRKKNLPTTFSSMSLHDKNPMTSEEISKKWLLPPPLADCYVRNSGIFKRIQTFRDNIIHRGYKIEVIFLGDKEFLIQSNLGPFKNLDIWDNEEIQQNNLVPLLPALSMIIYATIQACDDFALTLNSIIRYLHPTVPGMNLYMRGFHDDNLEQALADAEARVLKGRSLI